MDVKLNEINRRVLGVLMEKEMSQPDYYPMTLNAIVAACNQKQNRDPVMSLDEVAVEAALASLQEGGLLTMMFPAQGGRVKRYRHEVGQAFGWQKSERAVMAELLLRGPQTVGELRTRCQRFVQFADLESVSQVLDMLSRREPSMAAAMPREPGRTTIRHRHLLAAEEDEPSRPLTAAAERIEAVSAEGVVGQLRTEVAALREELRDLSRRLSILEDRSVPESSGASTLFGEDMPGAGEHERGINRAQSDDA